MLPIPFNEYPIEIDAEEDYAWADVPIVPVNHRFNTYTNLSSDTDGRAEFKVMWDYDYIYYLMESWDDTLVDDSGTAWHNDDAFEIYIDADASRKTSYDGVNDWGFSFHYVEDGILEPVGSSGMGPALDSAAVASIKQAQKLTGTGIKLEVAIPMSLLGIDVGNNAFIAIDADWDDDDDGGDRDTKIKTYDNTDNSWQNPSLMGLAKLVGSKIESDVDVVADAAITTYSLSQNYPNPFNPTTTIEFTLPETQNVKLIVYDVLGREVARLVDGRLQAGAHNVTFKAAQHASGMYFYRLEAGDFVQTKKLMLLK
jgi:hypothetical protein